MMDFWNAHGTKILGTLVAVLGVLVGLDSTQGVEIFGDIWQTVLTTAGGVLVILRGFVNSAAIRATKTS